MPYETISDLPDPVKDNLPVEAAEVWMSAYNSAERADRSEAERAAIAWGAVKAAGWEKGEGGRWVKKEAAKEEVEVFLTVAEGVFPSWLMDIIKKAAGLYKPKKESGDPDEAAAKENMEIRKNLVPAS